jgi:hypothetical protein
MLYSSSSYKVQMQGILRYIMILFSDHKSGKLICYSNEGVRYPFIMKAYGEMRVYFHSFLTSTLNKS